jgi:putative hydrolase
MAKYKGPVILGSDSHFSDRVGKFSEAVELVGEVGISQHRILNTSPEQVLGYLDSRRKQRGEFSNRVHLKLNVMA